MIDLKEFLKEINLTNYIPIDSSRIINKSGAIMVKTCPICTRKDHFWINKSRYGSYSKCCNGGSLWDWFMESEGLTNSKARKKVIETLNINPLRKSLAHTNQNLKLNKEIENMMEAEINKTFDILHKNAKILIKCNRHKNVYSRLIEILGDKKSLEAKYHCVKWIEGSFNI